MLSGDGHLMTDSPHARQAAPAALGWIDAAHVHARPHPHHERGHAGGGTAATLRVELAAAGGALYDGVLDLGSGRVAASETEAPNILANLV